jgi:hypothetical protein
VSLNVAQLALIFSIFHFKLTLLKCKVQCPCNGNRAALRLKEGSEIQIPRAFFLLKNVLIYLDEDATVANDTPHLTLCSLGSKD